MRDAARRHNAEDGNPGFDFRETRAILFAVYG